MSEKAGQAPTTLTDYYDNSSDSPTWTGSPDGSWTRNVTGLDGNTDASVAHVASGGTTTTTLQLMDLHGSVAATATPTSSGTTATYTYDEFGNTTNTSRYGWLGGKDRAETGVGNLTLMGRRLYDPATGRFLQTDPIPGGSANAYDYCHQDPVNRADLSGRYDYTYVWDIGAVSSTNTAASVWNLLTQHANWVFPFDTGGCSKMYAGEACHFRPGSPFPVVGKAIANDYLYVSSLNDQTMTMALTVIHWTAGDSAGSTITFTVWQQNGHVYLSQHGDAPGASLIMNLLAPLAARYSWGRMAMQIRWLTGVYARPASASPFFGA